MIALASLAAAACLLIILTAWIPDLVAAIRHRRRVRARLMMLDDFVQQDRAAALAEQPGKGAAEFIQTKNGPDAGLGTNVRASIHHIHSPADTLGSLWTRHS